jgi:ABC-2 type transport system ATP-binding protein
MVKTEGLTKHYGKLVALEDFSIEVPRGEILALVGPNGAGKTTALKLMVGLLSPTRGQTWIGNFDVQHQSLEAKRLLSFIPDQPFLYEQLTIAELLGFLGGVYQMDPATVEQRAAFLLELFGLDGSLAQRIGQLSYGMRSRLVLVASLLHEPQVLMMDEPFFGLDPQTLRLMKQFLRERAQTGMTVLLSTHQLGVVEDVAHRIAVLAQGRLRALGSLDALKQRYGGSRLEELFFRLTENREP